ncbi:hypothetical protein [Neobittarella massiliensis]|uniref:Uncharacterized protein n=1 Tax=uncultured Anaerotruncus sp. TaxID=905011 RepID=A0A1C6HLY9_9FIRM|nr:hypothetical protein [Neobittarella massiliensis]SCJ58405.1 Uncharacterised protein [uncultured Anaerotruncus sp.]
MSRHSGMTARELAHLGHLQREIELDRRRLRELEAAATDTSSRVTGLPWLGGVSDKTALAAAIADCKDAIERKTLRSLQQYQQVSDFIAGVDDSLLRQILSLRCLDHLTWRQVAAKVGYGNTEDSVKQAFHRFLKSSEQ